MRSTLLPFLPLAGVAFLTAVGVVAALVPAVRAFALRIGAVQEGGSGHGLGLRRHDGSVASVGGMAILGGFLVALIVGALVAPQALGDDRTALLAIVLGGVLMTLLGLLDDLWELPVAMRLAVQTVAAGILVANGVTIDFVTNYFAVGPLARWAGEGSFLFFGETLAAVLTLIWVVGFTNAFNFIDGVDGLSSGVAAIGSLSLLAVALQADGRGPSVLLLAALAGAAIGFLRHNAGPATIFMGDTGAYLLGYTLAATSVLGALKVTAAVTVATPLLILGLPVLNLTQVAVRRMRRGVSPTRATNDHLHDLLRARGRSDRGTVLTLWTATLLLGVAGMLLAETPPVLMGLTVVSAVVAIGGASALRWSEVRAAESGPRLGDGPGDAAGDVGTVGARPGSRSSRRR
ncbi:MAG: MraY family glycosyltransferase [Trueperaceae bacterium]|nr:MraY family glycosyltransferase [Trueperaceae bacterium]